MKFIVSSEHLYKKLAGISGVITNNPVVPILENFLFEIKENLLVVTGSDLQSSMVVEIDVESKEEGSIAVPAKILLDTLKNLPDQPVTFSVDLETYSIEISSDNGKYKISGENSTDFPKIPEVSDATEVNISTATLQAAINNTLFAASNDELRPAMTGVFIKLTGASTSFVATDGHRLVRYTRVDVTSDEDHTMIIPKKSLTLLKSALPSENSNVVMAFNPSNAFFSFGDTRLICRLIDERFPDYENVIPAENDNIMSISRSEMQGALRRISIFANRTTHQIRLKLSGSELQISAEDLDFSNEANERLSCEHTGEDIEIGFNAKFMLEMLSTLEGEVVDLKLKAPNKAGLLVPGEQDEAEDLLMLVMPVMLNQV